MFRHRFHSIRRQACMAAILAVVTTTGCASWNLQRFNLNKLRDDRAVDIDHRLEGTKPIVVNPF